MAFRRFNRFRPRRGFRRSARGRRGVRVPMASSARAGYQRANFIFVSTTALIGNVTSGYECANTLFELSKIKDRLADTGNAVGEAMANVSRSIDILAIDAHWDVMSREPTNVAVAGSGSTVYQGAQSYIIRASIISDRLGSTGIPESVNTNYGVNQFPVRTVPGSAPDVANLEWSWPVKTHWTDFETVYVLPQVYTDAIGENTLYAAQGTDVFIRRRRVRRRLRVRLDDWHGLYFQVSLLTPPGFAPADWNDFEQLSVRIHCTGTLWYRWRF